MITKRILALLLLVSTSYATANDALDKAINAEHRKDSMARDMFRNPKETITFFEIAADHKVLEITPGGSGWYTEILAPYLRDNGHITIGHFDPNSSSDYYKRNYKKLVDKFAASPDLYDKVEIGVFATPGKYEYGEDGTFDRVVTFRNVHNWTRSGDDEMKVIFSSFFKALKPGGKLGVIDHRLPEDRAKEYEGGYVKESYVIRLAEAAGFKLDGKSEVNANAKDTVESEKGVWRLPPSLREKDEAQKEKNRAIGESDRMTLLFVKPE